MYKHEKAPSVRRIRRAVLSLLYHDKRGSVSAVQGLLNVSPNVAPPMPTEEDGEIARAIVERVLYVRYDYAISENFPPTWAGVPHFRELLLDEFVDNRHHIQL